MSSLFYKMSNISILLCICIILSCSGKNYKKTNIQNIYLDQFDKIFVGNYSTRSQQFQKSDAVDYNLDINRLWPESKNDEYWYIWEQSYSKTKNKPFKQLIFNFEADSESSFICKIYKTKQIIDISKLISKKDFYELINSKDKTNQEGCELLFRLDPNKNFIGSNNKNDCHEITSTNSGNIKIQMLVNEKKITYIENLIEENNKNIPKITIFEKTYMK